MIISVRHLSYGTIQDGVEWLEKNVGPRQYYLHNQSGGHSWRYYADDRTLEIKDEKAAVMFCLKFGAS